MAWCAYCKEETEIYIGGDVPICTECFDAQEAIRNRPGWSVDFAVSRHPAPFIQLVESAQPDVAHGDFARLAFDLKADESRLVIDGV